MAKLPKPKAEHQPVRDKAIHRPTADKIKEHRERIRVNVIDKHGEIKDWCDIDNPAIWQEEK